MADAPEPTTTPTPIPGPARRRRRGQLPLRTILLLVAAAAVWLTVVVNRREIARLEGRLPALRPLDRALVVADPSQFAVVRRSPLWYDENVWDVSIPPGAFRLALATRGVPPQEGLAPPSRTAPLAPGRRVVAIENRPSDGGDGGSRVVVTVDGAPALTVDEPSGWDPRRGSMGGGTHDTSTQRRADGPLVLLRRVFVLPAPNGQFTTPTEPASGLLLWIEPDPGG
jgi:hypothetical protein